MTPRASGRQCGANRPENAGTKHDVAAVRHGTGERLDLGRVVDDPEVVAQPLDERPRDRHGPLQRVRRPAPPPPAATVVIEPVRRQHRPLARVHEHERAGAVRALGLSRLEAGLAEQRGLLVAEVAGDRHAGRSPAPVP